jgi:flagellin
MALAIATNTGASMAAASATSVNKDMETSMERLSTGKRINSAADDAAGVAIASRLSSEIRGNNQAIRNAMDGQGMINTSEGAHKEIENILQRMRELAVQAANDTNGTDDRTNLQAEVTQLKQEIDRIAEATTWAGQKLLNGAADGGSGTKSFNFQIGNATGAADSISVSMTAMNSTALSLQDANATVSISNIAESGAAPVPIITDLGSDGLMLLTQAAGGAATEIDVTIDDTNFTAADGDVLTLDIDGTTVTYTMGFDAALTDDAAGGAAGLAAAITAAGITGISASAAGAVLTVTKAASVSLEESASNQLTVNSFDAAETLSVDLDGTTVSVTNSAASGYTQDVDGTAAMLADAINAQDIPGITATVSNGVITLAKGNFDITTVAGAEAAINAIDTAIGTVNTQRANLGAISNRLDNTVSNLSNVNINLEAGRGRIEDADFAAESTSLAKSQILQQASTAMLAQANASKQSVLSLLQG